MRDKHLHGFTLVELLVVITIIGVLTALLLPAIQAAREAAHRVVCQNNVRQLALAAINHLEVHGHYPTGGWTWGFVGDADRGFGREQPGGWAYNILPFLEETSLHALTADGRPEEITLEQRQGAARLIETPVAVMYCGSFGGPHRGGFPMSYSDGSVRVIEYEIDMLVSQEGANRLDGLVPVPMRPDPTRPGRPPRPVWPPQ